MLRVLSSNWVERTGDVSVLRGGGSLLKSSELVFTRELLFFLSRHAEGAFCAVFAFMRALVPAK
jgi:hypothetical protein